MFVSCLRVCHRTTYLQCLWSQKRVTGSHRLELQSVVTAAWVLGIEFGSSARIARTLTSHRAISPALCIDNCIESSLVFYFHFCYLLVCPLRRSQSELNIKNNKK